MFGLCLFTILLIYVGANAIVAVNVFPSSQKVVENSPVVFTCVSPVLDAEIGWYLGQRPVDEETDEVSVKRINDFMSVLRIENAQIKTHKKTYTCRVQAEGIENGEKQATLKVLSKQRLHKYFPRIAPIISKDDVILPARDPGTIHMKCVTMVTAKKSKPSWRWIKDDFIDLTFEKEREEEDRIELSDDGDLIIRQTTVSDSGRYMCVAENNRGSAYGTPFTVAVQEGPPFPKLDGCVDSMGKSSKFGETYNLRGDPCVTCTCIEGVGLSCKSVTCIPKPCPPGHRLEMLPEKCCESRCISEAVRTEEETFESNGFCTDRNGKQVASGDSYMPEKDPCLRCECNNGRKGRCMMVACEAPMCEHYLSSRDVCCNYTCLPTPSRIKETCRDYNGRAVSNGEMYQPGNNPCESCECLNGEKGMCTQVVCDEPTCSNYRLIPWTCCGFECLEEEIETVEIDLDGSRDDNLPTNDPCTTCTCSDGRAPVCRSVACIPPPLRCLHGMRPVPGVCCQFECNEEPRITHASRNTEKGSHDGYLPTNDPCTTCSCSDGRAPVCRSVACIPPPLRCLHGMRPVPGVCCQFECNEEPRITHASRNTEKVLGRVFVQQIGTNSAFVQWKTPEKYAEMQSNLTVYYTQSSMDMRDAHVIHIGNRPNAILRDLDANTEHHVTVNGTLGNGTAFMTSRLVRFSLDGRGRSSFVLSDAIGQVFESRGSIAYDGYSLPQRFEPVIQTDAVKIVLNTDSFHRIEVSRYNEAPCMDQDCGLLRFYMYSVEGESRNVMSLMFTNEQDFSWAKAHL